MDFSQSFYQLSGYKENAFKMSGLNAIPVSTFGNENRGLDSILELEAHNLRILRCFWVHVSQILENWRKPSRLTVWRYDIFDSLLFHFLHTEAEFNVEREGDLKLSWTIAGLVRAKFSEEGSIEGDFWSLREGAFEDEEGDSVIQRGATFDTLDEELRRLSHNIGGSAHIQCNIDSLSACVAER